MFFNPPPSPSDFRINNAYFLKHSILLSGALESIRQSNQLLNPPPESTPELSPHPNKIVIPLTQKNLEKHNELIRKKEFEAKNINKDIKINQITDQKIIDDCKTPLTLKNFLDFINYLLDKRTLPENEKNDIKFYIFKNIINVKQKLGFRKKELVCLYIYLDRIYDRFNCFMDPSFPNNNKEIILYKNFIEDALCVALLKTLIVHKDCSLDIIKDTRPDIYNTYISYDRNIRNNIYYNDYKLYSKKFFE